MEYNKIEFLWEFGCYLDLEQYNIDGIAEVLELGLVDKFVTILDNKISDIEDYIIKEDKL